MMDWRWFSEVKAGIVSTFNREGEIVGLGLASHVGVNDLGEIQHDLMDFCM
jgi:hypothetical protein